VFEFELQPETNSLFRMALDPPSSAMAGTANRTSLRGANFAEMELAGADIVKIEGEKAKRLRRVVVVNYIMKLLEVVT
jgi:hypothetical protein